MFNYVHCIWDTFILSYNLRSLLWHNWNLPEVYNFHHISRVQLLLLQLFRLTRTIETASMFERYLVNISNRYVIEMHRCPTQIFHTIILVPPMWVPIAILWFREIASLQHSDPALLWCNSGGNHNVTLAENDFRWWPSWVLFNTIMIRWGHHLQRSHVRDVSSTMLYKCSWYSPIPSWLPVRVNYQIKCLHNSREHGYIYFFTNVLEQFYLFFRLLNHLIHTKQERQSTCV